MTVSAEVSPKWLLEPEFADKVHGIVVEVKASFGSSGWHNGDYEGKQGVVLSLFNTGNDTFDSTARVRFDDPIDVLQPILAVPVQFLVPVHPENKGEDVLVLAGSSKGQLARVEAVESRSLMVVTTRLSFLVIDTTPERLARVIEVDEVGNKKGR